MTISMLIAVAGSIVNLIAMIDAFSRWRRNKLSGSANGSLVYFWAHLQTKACLFFGQLMLISIIWLLPVSILRAELRHRAIAVEILRGAMSMTMAITGYVNMRSFQKLRDGK